MINHMINRTHITTYLDILTALFYPRLTFLAKVIKNGRRKTIIMLLLAIFLILPSLEFAEECSVGTNQMNSENAFIKCVPELIDETKAKPSTVCVITCKENSLRFKHRCNRNGQWDQAPDFDKCGKVVFCPHPNTNTSMNHWSWSCPGLSQGSKCNGVCKLSSNTTVQISCGKDKRWKTDNSDLDDVVLCPAKGGKLMIVGGFNDDDGSTNVTEIFDLDDETSICNVPSAYPFEVEYISVGVLGSNPIFCGGYGDSGNPKECFKYTIQGFKNFAKLTYEADYSASTVVQIDQQDILWISGGNDMEDKSQEVYSNGTITEGPRLPERLTNHCVLAINKTTVLVIGGLKNDTGYASKKTFGYNFELGQWYNGPDMLNERVDHACGVIKNSLNLMVAVIGGYNNNQNGYLDSVEFAVLDEDTTSTMTWEWKYGPQFPFKIAFSTAISINSKLYVVGGRREQSSSYFTVDTIIELAENHTWIVLPQKMRVARDGVAAIILPEDLVTCENKKPSSKLAGRQNSEL